MKRTALLLTVACGLWTVWPAFGMDRLSALSMLETGNNDRQIGRKGEVTRFQILPRLWRQYGQGDPMNATDAARAVQRIMSERLGRAALPRRLPHPITNFDFYVLWNAPAEIRHPSPVVRERACRFANLCSIR